MTAKEYKENLLKEYEAHLSGANGHATHAFYKAGKKAFESLEQLEFPTKKHEEWKYTTLDRVLKKAPQVPKWSSDFNDAWAESAHIPNLEATQIILHNGKLHGHEDLPSGVSLSAVTKGAETADWKETDNEDIFENINKAFAFDQVSIEIASGTVVEKPIYIINILDASDDALLAQRNFSVNIGKSAEATIIEKQVTIGTNTSLSNGV